MPISFPICPLVVPAFFLFKSLCVNLFRGSEDESVACVCVCVVFFFLASEGDG